MYLSIMILSHSSINGMAVARTQLFPEKPVLVFLHDSLGCIELWRDWPLQLAEAIQCDVLIYDRIGYGKSAPMESHVRPVNYMELEADNLNALLRELDISKALLFGHSDGGTIALLAAAKYSESIVGVVAEAAHIFVEEITLKGIREAMEAYKNTSLPIKLARYHGEKVDTLFKAWTETWTRADFRDWNIEYMLPEITCPVLFIQGSEDEYGSLHQVNRTIDSVSGIGESLILEGLGHSPHKEDSERVLSIITPFLIRLLSNKL